MKIFHNIEQNHVVEFADDLADRIVKEGFAGSEVFFSDRPIVDSARPIFVGISIEIQEEEASRYRVAAADAIEELGVQVYCLPTEVCNTFSIERWYPREDECVET